VTGSVQLEISFRSLSGCRASVRARWYEQQLEAPLVWYHDVMPLALVRGAKEAASESELVKQLGTICSES
jgi:hypothetical protein